MSSWASARFPQTLTLLPARPSLNRQPFEHAYQDVVDVDASSARPVAKRDPFIYNPSKGGPAAKVRPTLVQNDIAELFVTLQNPFLFDLEVQNIELRYGTRSE